MVTLTKNSQSSDSGLGEELGAPAVKNPEQWVKAAEFVPGQLWQGSGRDGCYQSNWMNKSVSYSETFMLPSMYSSYWGVVYMLDRWKSLETLSFSFSF